MLSPDVADNTVAGAMKNKLIAGNWKMNYGIKETREFFYSNAFIFQLFMRVDDSILQ